MKHSAVVISVLAVAGCGGKQPDPVEPKAPEPEATVDPEAKVKAEPEPEPAPPEPPPPAKAWHAQANLTPVKGVKIKSATVTFTQTEGQPVNVGSSGWFDGIKSGKYHLVVHAAAACGPNASKAGKPSGADIDFVAVAGMDTLEVQEVSAIQLGGTSSVVGRVLVLHDDKNGKPGKALACGTIASSE